MIYFLGILFFLLAFLLICAILLQEGKGGGLAAMSGAVTDSVMGAKNPLRRLTVYFFICFITLVLGLNYYINTAQDASINPGLTPVLLDDLSLTPGAGEAKPEADAANTNGAQDEKKPEETPAEKTEAGEAKATEAAGEAKPETVTE